jgi:hypothetical protein
VIPNILKKIPVRTHHFKILLKLSKSNFQVFVKAYRTALKGIFNLSAMHSVSFLFPFSFFEDNESPEKPSLELFGVEGTQPIRSLDQIILKIEEIEELCSNSQGRNSSSSSCLDMLKSHKKTLIQTLTSHEVHVCLSACSHMFIYLAMCM